MKTVFKKSTLFIVITVSSILISKLSHGQETNLKLLVNSVTTNFNYGKDNSKLEAFKKNKMGLQAGLSFQAGLTRRVSLVAEGYYIMKGGDIKSNYDKGIKKASVRLHSVEMPIMTRIHFGRFYFNSGPYVSYLMGGKLKMGSLIRSSEQSGAVYFNNGENGFNRWEMGLQAGGGYIFNMKKMNVALDIRYGYGLTSLSQDMNRYNRMLNVSVLIYTPWKINPLALKVN
jgi:hypothetical protein